MPPPSRMPSAPCGGVGMPAATWARPEAAKASAPEADADAGVGRVVLRRAQQADAEEEQGERHGIRDAAEGAGDDGVDDVADRALEGPPLTGGHDDRQADEEEAEPVAAVLRLELAGAGADPADRAAGDVRHAHPGAPDGAQRQRQPAAAGLAAGGGLAGRAALAVGGACCGAPAPGRADPAWSASRWTDVSPWSAGYAKVTPETRVTRVPPRAMCPDPDPRPNGRVCRRDRAREAPVSPYQARDARVTRWALRLAGPAPTTSDGRRRRRASRGIGRAGRRSADRPRQTAAAGRPSGLAATSQMTGRPPTCWIGARRRRYPRRPGHECQREAPAC